MKIFQLFIYVSFVSACAQQPIEKPIEQPSNKEILTKETFTHFLHEADVEKNIKQN